MIPLSVELKVNFRDRYFEIVYYKPHRDSQVGQYRSAIGRSQAVGS